MQIDRYVGEIIIFAGQFAPEGWALCDGRLLPLSDGRNHVLFSLIGNLYGGDGRMNFALPDLRGRFPMHMGAGPGLTARTVGDVGGSENFTLGVDHLPPHRHALLFNDAPATQATPNAAVPAAAKGPDGSDPGPRLYRADNPNALMHAGAIGSTGSGTPAPHMPPFQVVNFLIAIDGIIPNHPPNA